MLDRRQFLARSLATGAACSLASPSFLSAIEPINSPNKPGKVKLSLAAYSFRDSLQGKRSDRPMDLFQFIDYCAEQGLKGTELTSYYFPEPVTNDYLTRIKEHVAKRGLTISGGAIRNDFCQRPGAKLDAEMAQAGVWIKHYAFLGAPAIRFFAGNVPKGVTQEQATEWCIAAFEKIAPVAADHNVKIAIENHGGITAKAEGLLAIVKGITSPAVGINFDSGNFRSTDDPYAELKQIAPYAVNAQVKVDMYPGGKHQPADLKRIIGILREAGYNGWVALEYESKEDPYVAVPRYLDELKKYTDA